MTEALADVVAAVRRITARLFDGNGNGIGACVVWGDPRTVVTNAHVIHRRRATVQFHDGSCLEARVRERDLESDLAVLELATFAPVAPCGVRDAKTLRPGEIVLAVGDPLGLVGSAATGIVQRRTRRYVVADLRLLPGNSGGPLADAQGRVAGINSMVSDGLALAVPSESVRSFLRAAGSRAA